MWQYRYQDELYHHGVKGMKWGVRKAVSKLGSAYDKITGADKIYESMMKGSKTKKKRSGTSSASTKASNPKKSSPKKKVETGKKSSPKKKVETGKKSALKTMANIGSLSLQTAARYKKNQATMNAIGGLLEGNGAKTADAIFERTMYGRFESGLDWYRNN